MVGDRSPMKEMEEKKKRRKKRGGKRRKGIRSRGPSREKKLVRGLAGDGDGETYLTNGEVH